ncbi:ABC transporter substrate-binding protein [Spirillospora sp. NPDC029432]|uniref:ABC transporter substrate-binding protein n=1 Tax=Spirillospora sp. NPDC029432 TaxID=3154599 RepID=UPI003455E438
MPEIAPLREGDPRTLGPYRLTGLLGEGGQGSVYLGERDADPESPEGGSDGVRRVAVKLLHARLSGDAKARARFADELRTAGRVAAFCTARVLDSDVEGDRPYIVSEYIDGPSLSEVLAAAGPREGPALDRLAIGTMTALAAIHQAGVVHRDFKPHNVLMAPDGPRVIDFGIARALDATGTLSSTAVGTPAYMAPEQFSGTAIGPAADVWAWGATMIYAATGRPAFGQDSIPAVMHRILNFPPDLGSLGEPLRGLVQSCLNKDPAYRPSSQQILVHLLNLAGSLPAAAAEGQGGPGGQDAQSTAVLNQGAAAAATHTTTRLAVDSPAPPPGIPYGQVSYQQQPPPSPWNAPAPPPAPAPQQWGTPATWPGGNGPGGNGPGGTAGAGKPGRRRPGVGVLAGAGSAALVALIVAGTAIAVQLRDRGDDPPAGGGSGRTGGAIALAQSTLSSDRELSPSVAGYGTERLIAKQLFTGLVEITPDGAVRNRMASRLTPAPGCGSWRIDLKTGTTFSNGEPVDAAAFVRGWVRAAQDPTGLASLYIGDVKGFADVNGGKSDDFSGIRRSGDGFDVELVSPDCEFDRRLANPVLAPLPADALKYDNAAYNQRPVGNGPFKVQSYEKDRRVTLVRNDAWAFGKARLDRVTINLTPDTGAVGRAGFRAGEFQWAALQADGTAAATRDPALVTRTTQSLNYLVPITARGPMKSKDARLAVSYALDRRKISDTVYGGLNPPARSIVPPSIPGFEKAGSCPSCDTHDPATARRYAEAAGLKPGAEVRLYVRGLPSHRRWGEVVKQQLETALGWRIDLKMQAEYDHSAWVRDLTSGDATGLATLGWQPDVPTAFSMLRPILSSDLVATKDNGYSNYSGWKDARFDHLIWETPRTADANGRLQRMREAEKRALDDMAIIPVVNHGSAALRSDRLTGLGMDIDGDPTLATAAYK